MTIRELWMLVVRFWKLVVAIILVCTICGAGFSVLKRADDSYEAEACIAVGSNVNNVAGFAENIKRGMQQELDTQGVSVTIDADTQLMIVSVTAKSADSDVCVQIANSIAEEANEMAVRIYADSESPYQGEVSIAQEATPVVSKNLAKFLVFGFAGGVFVALVVIVLIDLKRRYVKTVSSVQQLTDLPVLEVLPAKNGDKLLANVRFAARRAGTGEDALSVVVVPVGKRACADEVLKLLEASASAEGLSHFGAVSTPSLSESMAAAYDASQGASVVVVTVTQWEDSLVSLASTVEELQFAEAKIAGLVFCEAGERNR